MTISSDSTDTFTDTVSAVRDHRISDLDIADLEARNAELDELLVMTGLVRLSS